MNATSVTPQYPGSILSRVTEADVKEHPFPHVIIRDAIPADLAKELTGSFPLQHFGNLSNNARRDISVGQLEGKEITQAWKDFIRFHSSQEFWDQFVTVFGSHILKLNPDYYQSIDQLRSLKAGHRKVDTFENADVLIDAQISINAPVTEKSSVRKAHVDSADKIFSGLLYLRQPDDDTKGGNLQILKWKDRYSERKKEATYKEGVGSKHLDLVEELEYDNNVCVLFLNSLDSLHGVTPREVTSHVRTFANFVAEIPHTLYYKRSRSFRKAAKERIVRLAGLFGAKKKPRA